MERYSVYGLTLESPYEIPELPTADRSGDPDVVVETDDVEPVVSPDADVLGGRRLIADGDVCRITYEAIGTFSIESGERVRFDPERPDVTETKAFRRLLAGQVLAMALHQRGVFVLHASAVADGTRAVVFVGDVGAGKSTTAGAFVAGGWTLLDDDVVAIRFADGAPVVAPGIPQLKLCPDAAGALDLETARPDSDDGRSGKRYHLTEPVADPVPLAAVYVLEEGDAHAVDPISPHDRLLEFIAHTYTSGLIDSAGASEVHFEQCSRVLRSTPVRTLRRPVDLDGLDSVVETVETDVAEGTAARRTSDPPST